MQGFKHTCPFRMWQVYAISLVNDFLPGDYDMRNSQCLARGFDSAKKGFAPTFIASSLSALRASKIHKLQFGSEVVQLGGELQGRVKQKFLAAG